MRGRLDLDTLQLGVGTHASGSMEMCVMEAVAFESGQRWSAEPEGVSPVVASALRYLNDAVDDRARQQLKSLIAATIDSAGDRPLEARRSWMLLAWHCRVAAPQWLDAAGLADESAQLRGVDWLRPDSLTAVLPQLELAVEAARGRYRAAIAATVASSWDRAVEAASVGPDPDLEKARAAASEAVAWPTLARAVARVPADLGWSAVAADRWRVVWEAIWETASAIGTAAPIETMRALSTSATWWADWQVPVDTDRRRWDQVRDLALEAARNSVMCIAWAAAWGAGRKRPRIRRTRTTGSGLPPLSDPSHWPFRRAWLSCWREWSRPTVVELLSVHIPKTAGTSFRAVLEAAYGPTEIHTVYPTVSNGTDNETWFRDSMTLCRCSPPPRVIHGHYLLTWYAERFPRAQAIAWLREPVDRIASLYFMWRSVTPWPQASALWRAVHEGGVDLREFARMPGARDQMTRTLIGDPDARRLKFIGIMERFDDDLERLGKALGWPTVTAPRVNINTSEAYLERDLSTSLRREIESLNPSDVALYRQVLAGRWRGAGVTSGRAQPPGSGPSSVEV